MNRRDFFGRTASGLFLAIAPGLFLPKLIKPAWKPLPQISGEEYYKKILERLTDVWDYQIAETGGIAPVTVLIGGNPHAIIQPGQTLRFRASRQDQLSLQGTGCQVQVMSIQV